MLRCLLSSLFGPGTASSTAASWPDAFMFRMGLSAIGCKQSEAVIRKKFDEVCTCLVPCNNEAPTTVTTAKESHPAGAHLLLHLPCHRWESYTYAGVCTGGALLWCKMPCGKSWSDTRQHLTKLQRLSLLILQHPLSHPGWNLKSLLDRGTLPSCHHLRCISGSRWTTASGDHYRSDCQPLDLQCKRPNHLYFQKYLLLPLWELFGWKNPDYFSTQAQDDLHLRNARYRAFFGDSPGGQSRPTRWSGKAAATSGPEKRWRNHWFAVLWESARWLF